MAHVLVTGGTGVLGSEVVRALRARDHGVRVLSRRPVQVVTQGATTAVGDLARGTGLAAALADVDTVVHCATDPRRPKAVDLAGTRRLLQAASRTGRPHVVDVSIVGCDRIPLPYYAVKTSAEEAVAASGLPWTVLRATQFHPLMLTIGLLLTRSPVVPVPRGVPGQPVDVRDVAARVVELVEAGPACRVDDLGGPEVLPLEQILRSVAAALGRRRRFVGVPLPGRIAAGYRAGHHLAPGRSVGSRTFASYLAEFVGSADVGTTSRRVRHPYAGR